MAQRGRVILDPTAINALLLATTDAAARRGAEATQRRVRNNITASGRVATGRMRDQVRVQRVSSGVKVNHYRVTGDAPYTLYQEEGIGPVTPVRARVLRFKPRGANVFIFRPRTRGFAGAHFFRRAFEAIQLSDFT